MEVDPDDIPSFRIVENWDRWTNREYIPDEGGEQRLLVIGDSFGEAFLPYLVDKYAQVSFRRFDIDYGYYDALDVQPDIVMLELTERFFTPEVIAETLKTEE